MHDETGEAIAEALADNVTLLSMNVRIKKKWATQAFRPKKQPWKRVHLPLRRGIILTTLSGFRGFKKQAVPFRRIRHFKVPFLKTERKFNL